MSVDFCSKNLLPPSIYHVKPICALPNTLIQNFDIRYQSQNGQGRYGSRTPFPLALGCCPGSSSVMGDGKPNREPTSPCVEHTSLCISSYPPVDPCADCLFPVAVLRGDSNVQGTVVFEQADEGAPTTVSWDISGHDASAEVSLRI